MPDLRNRLLSLSVMPCLLTASALAQPEQPTSPTPGLTPEEVQHAIRTDAMTVPTPGEVFAAIDKGGKPNWSSQYRPPTSFNSTSRAQVALNLGR